MRAVLDVLEPALLGCHQGAVMLPGGLLSLVQEGAHIRHVAWVLCHGSGLAVASMYFHRSTHRGCSR